MIVLCNLLGFRSPIAVKIAGIILSGLFIILFVGQLIRTDHIEAKFGLDYKNKFRQLVFVVMDAASAPTKLSHDMLAEIIRQNDGLTVFPAIEINFDSEFFSFGEKHSDYLNNEHELRFYDNREKNSSFHRLRIKAYHLPLEQLVVQKWTLIILLVICMFALCSAYIIVIINLMVAKPVKHLADATKNIAAGDFNYRIEINRNDELGELECCFNRMLNIIQNDKVLFDTQNRDLEILVEKRTSKVVNAYKLQHSISIILQRSLQNVPFVEQLEYVIETLFEQEVFGFLRKGCIFVADEAEDILTMVAQKGLSDELREKCKQIRFGKCLCGMAATKREIIFVNCVDKRHEILSRDMQPHGHYCVPILSNNEVLGVITLYVKEHHQEKPEEKELLRIIANTLSNVMARKNAHDFMNVHQNVLEEMIEEIAEARNQALNASENKSNFLASMSHEIRTPLTAIIGFSETILESKMFSEDCKLINIIVNNGKHLLKLINDILDLSKIEANRLETECIDFPFVPLLLDVKAIIDEQAKENDLSFAIEWCFPIATTITSDPMRLKQILINLCNNAIKFTEKGWIRLTVWFDQETPCVQFRISDSGIGMTAEQLEKVFEPFVQAEAHTTRKFGGTGLGLNITKRLVKMLGGKIDVASTLGEGSTFSFTIDPGSLDSKEWIMDKNILKKLTDFEDSKTCQLTTAQAASTAIAHTKNKLSGHILLAEDNCDNQELIVHILKNTGISITLANNGQEAVEKAKSEPFALILMDMRMPVMDGVEAAKTLREFGFSQPIIALTANVMKQEQEIFMAAGCNSFVAKPIDRRQLVDTISHYLRDNKTEEKVAAPRNVKTGLKILLAEDNSADCELITKIISKTNADLTVVKNGRAVVTKALTEDFDLLLLDIQMPILSGLKTTLLLRDSGYFVPIIAITASFSEQETNEYLAAGFSDCIPKPIDHGDLLLLIRTYLPTCVNKDQSNNDAQLQQTTQPPNDKASSTEPPRGHILYAEDDHVNQRLVARLLRDTGLSLTMVDNGEKALEQALNNDFDLILMDIQMPVMDGAEATKLMRGSGIEKPIIALTANVLEGDLERYLDVGFIDVIGKPIDKKIFAQKIDLHLPIQQKQEQNSDGDDFDNDPEYQAMVLRFRDKFLPEKMESLGAALHIGDFDKIKDITHTIKGTAGNFGFHEVSTIAGKIEHKMKMHDNKNTSEIYQELIEACKCAID